MSNFWLEIGTGSQVSKIPITMDHEGQIDDYLKNRFRPEEMPFQHAVLDDYAMPEIAAEVVVNNPPRETELPRVGINEFIFPTGMTRFSRGLFLIDKTHIADLVNHCWGINWDGTGQIPDDSAANRTEDPARFYTTDDLEAEVFVQRLYLLPPIQVDSSSDNELFIVPMVDFRWLALHFTINSTEFDVGSATTWQDLLNSIYQATPAYIEFDPSVNVSADYLQPDPGYFAASRSAAYAIDHFANSTGNRIVVIMDGAGDEKIKIQSFGEAANKAVLPETAIFGKMNASGTKPGAVRLSYRLLFDHADNETWWSAKATLNNHDGPEVHVVSTFYEEYYSEVIDPSSEQSRTDLLTVISQNTQGWLSGPNYAVTVPGGLDVAVFLESSGFTDYTLIKVDCSAAIPQLVTTYQSRKPNFYSPVNLSQQPGLYRHP
ncbi:MAG: hypothetical protein CMJ25_11235 [Phycisphaerae bacterium]|nr:hypothetical protein [Phycisphaerae bacterium]|tara:strand:- start:5489 stop:6784 length:1296 start_codon:yes stop_codon:yes gene_type:complete